MLLGPTLDLLNRHLWDSILCFNSSPGSSWDHPGSSNRGREPPGVALYVSVGGDYEFWYQWQHQQLVRLGASVLFPWRGQSSIVSTSGEFEPSLLLGFYQPEGSLASVWFKSRSVATLDSRKQSWGIFEHSGKEGPGRGETELFLLLRRFCCCMMQSWSLFYTSIYKGGYPRYAKRYLYLLIYTFSQFCLR